MVPASWRCCALVLEDVSGCVLLCGLSLQFSHRDRSLSTPKIRSGSVLTQSPPWTWTALISLSLGPRLLPKTMRRCWMCSNPGCPD